MTYKDLRDKVSDMPSYILDDDFIIYHRYLPLISKHEEIVDVGTGWGKSVTAMAIMNPGVTIFTIDDGSYPIYQGWAKDVNEYRAKLKEEFKKHEVRNIQLCIKDVNDNYIVHKNMYALVHIDLTKEAEIEGLKTWLSCIKVGGLALIRNFERMGDISELLKDFEEIDRAGLIKVYRKVIGRYGNI